MLVPVPVLVTGLVVAVALVGVTVASAGAWYGIMRQREDERRRILGTIWRCERCGGQIRLVGQQIDGGQE